MIKIQKKLRGFSLAEIVVASAIIVFVGLAISNFGRDIFFLNSSIQGNLSAQIDARRVLRTFVSEIRSTSPSSLGAYPIVTVASSTFTFYSNIDDDSHKERIRYFREGSELRRGIIDPSGNPLAYNAVNEKVDTIARDLINSPVTPIFEYFNSSFSGTTTPMAEPIDILSVRLVRVTLIIDKDVNRPPGSITVTTQGTMRNLKDNL